MEIGNSANLSNALHCSIAQYLQLNGYLMLNQPLGSGHKVLDYGLT